MRGSLQEGKLGQDVTRSGPSAPWASQRLKKLDLGNGLSSQSKGEGETINPDDAIIEGSRLPYEYRCQERLKQRGKDIDGQTIGIR